MLVAVCLIAAATSVLVVLRWTVTRVDALGRARAFPAFATGIPLAVVLATGIPILEHGRLENRLAEAASQLVGAPVSVHCQTLGEAWTDSGTEAGFVRFGADGRPEHATTLALQTCADLRSWLASDRSRPSLVQIVAVHVLTHESMHMAGQRNEARAECAAVQRDVRTAELLGADADQARALAAAYWTEVYPLLTADYRSSDCGPDGLLDEHGQDAPWWLVKTSQNS